MVDHPRFDLFAGIPDRDPIWIESIDGLANALAQLKKLAADKPGAYFVFSTSTYKVVAEIDTTSQNTKHDWGCAKMPTSDEKSYEIFRKEPDNTTVLVEAVKGLKEALKRIDRLNGEGPGEHFILDAASGKLIEPSSPGQSQDPFAL